jgi:hypothetical protein
VCRSVKKNTHRPAERLDPKISLDVDVTIPLYLVVVKCSATSVRREAIELLLNYPRWEGLWDSLVSVNIAKWVMDVESVYEG